MTTLSPPRAGEYRSLTASVAYLGPMSEYPIFHSGYPDAENLNVDLREVTIRNARDHPGGAGLQSHGFQLVDFPSQIKDFSKPASFAENYANETAKFVKAVTGASEVLISPAAITTRFSDRKGAIGGAERAARFCHNDFTPGSTGIHIANEFPSVSKKRLSDRYAAYNVWRCLSPPPQDMPLAVCDPRSVMPADVVTAQARYGDPKEFGIWGEVALFRYNPAHRWFYFPEMQPNEVLIFAGYDSDPRFPSIVPHTAVDDLYCPKDAPVRWNVDLRCYALFD